MRYSKLDGWVKNLAQPLTNPYAPAFPLPGRASKTTPHSRDLLGRLTLKWTPSPSFNMTGKLFIADNENNDPTYGMQAVCAPGAVPLSFGIPDPTGDCKFDGRTSVTVAPAAFSANFPFAKDRPYTDFKAMFAGLTANYNFGPFGLTSVTGYYKLKSSQFGGSYDFTSVGRIFSPQTENTEVISQELRLSSDFDGPINFTAGAYYDHTDRSGFNSAMIAFVGADAQNRFHSFERFADNKMKTYSVFGQLRWDILDNIELAGGARWTQEKKSVVLVNTFVHSALVASFRPQGDALTGRYNDDNVSPEVTLTWHPTSNSTLYAAYKTGYKSGGFSNTSVITRVFNNDNIRFAPEKAKGGEIGYKAEFFGRTLRVEATAYLYDYKGLQLTSLDTVTISYQIRNAAAARTKGLELTANWRASSQLSLQGAIAYNRARFRDFTGSPCWAGQLPAEGCVGGTQDLTGRPLARAPNWSGTMTVNYDVPISGLLNLGLNADLKYSGSYWAIETLQPLGKQDSFWLIGMGARLSSNTQGWELALLGRNLTNKFYMLQMADKTGGGRGQIAGPTNRPREIILQGTIRF